MTAGCAGEERGMKEKRKGGAISVGLLCILCLYMQLFWVYLWFILSAGLEEVNLRSYKYRDDNALDQAEGNSEITDGKQTVNGEQQAHLARLRAAGQVSYFKL